MIFKEHFYLQSYDLLSPILLLSSLVLQSSFCNRCMSSFASSSTLGSDSQHFLLNLIQQTHKISETSSVYISNQNPNYAVSPLIRYFHSESISTITGHEALCRSQKQSKIILFIIPTCSDILNLIMNSAEESKVRCHHLVELNGGFIPKNGSSKNRGYNEVPNYCIDYSEADKTRRIGDQKKTCDFIVNITENDLRPGSEMSDSLFAQTQGLFYHPIWNAENYLIFAVQNEEESNFQKGSVRHAGASINCDLIFIFKLMWRLFRAFRAVICIEEACTRYDPSKAVLTAFPSRSDFNIPPPTLAGQTLFLSLGVNNDISDGVFRLKYWDDAVLSVMRMIVEHMGGSFELRIDLHWTPNALFFPEDYSYALKQGADVLIFESSLEDTDFRHLDVVPLLDQGEIVFMVPDKGFMPSFLTPAKCFSKLVWLLIIGSFVLLGFVHEIYRRVCLLAESSTGEPQLADNVSTIFAIFSYIICVGQSRLLVGSSTGRILFTVFTFSTLILSTAFLSLMVTYFSEKVRYTPLNTAEELRESDLLFQLSISDGVGLLTSDPKYEWLIEHMVASYLFLKSELNLNLGWKGFVVYAEDADEVYWGGNSFNFSEATVKRVFMAIREIFRSNAFITFLPYLARKNDLLTVPDPSSSYVTHDYHIATESIMSYPFDMRLLSNSPYGKRIKAISAHLLEAGILAESYEVEIGPRYLARLKQFDDEKGDPARAFTMVDLQLAFICLIVGHVLSSFVFIAELFYCDVVSQRKCRKIARR
ncbi:unnamed protein product [Bemisia tabaci]|uniref:Ionotropic receptor n=1 Tax=Bemisia tabaci TaxID=7038 RepID=A0A9P0AJL6_BEMTA|nr:unnamed protein product [Bemisia tabaci]